MAKDYGQRRPQRQKSSSTKRFLGLLASFLLGYLTGTVFDFTSLTSWVNANILAKHRPQKHKHELAAKTPELPKPNFEFYTLLAKDGRTEIKSVNQPAASTSTSQQVDKTVEAVESKPVSQASSSKDFYQIQLAAFKNRQDAEHMKAELTLKGFDVTVVASSQQRGTWYRVIVGPFNSRSLAEKAQLNLAQNERLKGILRKVVV